MRKSQARRFTLGAHCRPKPDNGHTKFCPFCELRHGLQESMIGKQRDILREYCEKHLTKESRTHSKTSEAFYGDPIKT
jgi:hypothetical protein